MHYSTDYVFDGQPGRAWREDDQTSPAGVYGQTKLAGEEAIAASGARALILRTAWLYSALPGNFLSAVLARAARGEPLRVVQDQIGSPTWAGSLAEITCDLLSGFSMSGQVETFHVADRGHMSWHEFAVAAVERAFQLGLIAEKVGVEPISSADWPQRARRPTWSALDVTAVEQRLNRTLPATLDALESCLRQWKSLPC